MFNSNYRKKKVDLTGAFLTIAYLCIVSMAGKIIHSDYVFFPELAALAYGMFTRLAGPWAKSPLMVIATPTVTALWGVIVANNLPYGIPAAMLCIVGSIFAVKAMRSPVFPAVPAGFLPLVFNVTSAHYVVFIAFDTGFLALLSIAYVRWRRLSVDTANFDHVDTPTHVGARSTKIRWSVFSSALAIAYFIAARAGVRLVLFPPLIVIAYETLVRAESCPWAQRYTALPVICIATAVFGWGSVVLFGTGPLSVLAALGASIILIRLARAFVLPALAISVIPQIMGHVDWKYPLAIATGTCVVMTSRLILNVIERWQTRFATICAID